MELKNVKDIGGLLDAILAVDESRRDWRDRDETLSASRYRLKYIMNFINIQPNAQLATLYRLCDNLPTTEIAKRVGISYARVDVVCYQTVGKLARSEVAYRVLYTGIEAFEAYLEFLGADRPLSFVPEYYSKPFYQSFFKKLRIMTLSNLEEYSYSAIRKISPRAEGFVKELAKNYGLNIKD